MSTAMSVGSSISDDTDFLNLSFWKGSGPADDALYAEDTSFEPVQLDLHTACSLGKYDIATALLQSPTCSVNARNHGGWTPLMYAAYIGHENIVTLLLQQPTVDVNKKNKLGQTPLMLAVSCGNENVAQFLYQAQADLESHDERGWTPLFHATYNGHQNLVKFLCENRANIDAVEPLQGCTPLMLATTEGHEIIVQYLLENGANWKLKNLQEDTARALALGNGYMKIVSLIDIYNRGPAKSLALVTNGKPGPAHTDAISATMARCNIGPAAKDGLSKDVATGKGGGGHPTVGIERANQLPTINTLEKVATILKGEKDSLPQTVKEFLDNLKLTKYLSLFDEQEIDLQVLLTMSDNDLKEIGLTLLGPRRKITSAIARHHSMVQSKARPEEKAYADMLENGMQEMAEQLSNAQGEVTRLVQRLSQEQEIRTVTEKLLMDQKVQWDTTLCDSAINRTYCHKVFHALSSVGQCVTQLKQLRNGRSFEAAESASINCNVEAIAKSVATATQTMAIILRNIEKILQLADKDGST